LNQEIIKQRKIWALPQKKKASGGVHQTSNSAGTPADCDAETKVTASLIL
jgi:hypothetical protein